MTSGGPSLFANNPSFTLRYAVKRLRFALPLLGGRPAVTYAAFRSSSTAIHHAIRAAGIGVAVKAHMLSREHMLRRISERVSFIHEGTRLPRSCHVGDWAVRIGIVEQRRPADFVIPIRDPWAIAHSCFVLAAADADPMFAKERLSAERVDEGALVDRAEQLIFGDFCRDFMCRWILEDAAPALGWDPLRLPFDVERGAAAYEHGPWRIQVIRADLTDETKSAVLGQFFGRPSIRVTRKNEALSRSNASVIVANAARAAIARRPDAVHALLEHDVCKHYWNDCDRQQMWRKWTLQK